MSNGMARLRVTRYGGGLTSSRNVELTGVTGVSASPVDLFRHLRHLHHLHHPQLISVIRDFHSRREEDPERLLTTFDVTLHLANHLPYAAGTY